MTVLLRKIFTIEVVLFPILYVYNFFKTISVADFILLCLIPCLIIDTIANKKKLKINIPIFFISTLMVIQLFIYYIVGISSSDAVLTSLRIIIYYLVCSLFIGRYFDFNFGYSSFKYVTLIAAIFGLLQYFSFNFLGFYIQGTIPGLSTQIDSYNQMMNAGLWTSYAIARPRSFFLEPSHFSVYAILGLLFYLYENKKSDVYKIIIIVISILLSGSGMGIILLFILLIIFSIKRFKDLKKIGQKKFILLLFLLGVIFMMSPFYTKTEAFQTFFVRTFVEKDSTTGRFGNFTEAFNTNKDIFKIIFGEGMYKIADIPGQKYITSIPRIYTYFGVIGLFIFLILVVWNFLNLKGINFYTWLILFSISFASEILFHSLVIVFIPFIILNEKLSNVAVYKIEKDEFCERKLI